ncbi:MAG: division/cell wall cluster transcriptional repressor MraZ [Xanthomonadales bacterium]|nr:division/cell wall cluster transcriptional repressor MraZ [Xanthomonadales bacterium]
MFQGETAITIDDKGRMSIPTAHRELIASQCGNRLVFTYNPFEQGCLWLLPVRDWEKVRDEVNSLTRTVAAHRNLQLKLVGAACHVDVDGNGRVLVPASQRTATGLGKNAVLLGMGSKFELWAEEAHPRQIAMTIGESAVTPEMSKLSL